MAKAKRGRLGPYRLGRQHRSWTLEELGQLYEAHNVHTGAAALVLVPGAQLQHWKPEEDWTVRTTIRASPPYVALEVEQAPAKGDMVWVAGMLHVLNRAVERMEWSEETRRHFLTREPPGRLMRWVEGARRLLGERGLGLGIAAFLVLLLVVAHWRASIESQRSEQHEATAVAVPADEESRAPALVNTPNGDPAAIAYPLPVKPFSDQAKAPCKPTLDEVEINGGCWLELAKRPPCGENYAEYQGKCFVPVSARSRKPREPQSISP
ncbi:MAG TPA: protein kinase [Archangium sp.]|nr:protein kinase [Archangium sp.]